MVGGVKLMLQTAMGNGFGRERRDDPDCVTGKVVGRRDVMLQTVQGGKWSVRKDVMLQTVQGERGR